MNTKKLKALAQAASPGRWVSGVIPVPAIEHGTMFCADGRSFDSNVSHALTGLAGDEQSAKDAAYIAAACPETILELIEELEGWRDRG